jgi:hypothetical protein
MVTRPGVAVARASHSRTQGTPPPRSRGCGPHTAEGAEDAAVTRQGAAKRTSHTPGPRRASSSQLGQGQGSQLGHATEPRAAQPREAEPRATDPGQPALSNLTAARARILAPASQRVPPSHCGTPASAPTTANQQPDSRQPATSNQQPATSNQQPATSNQTSRQANGRQLTRKVTRGAP